MKKKRAEKKLLYEYWSSKQGPRNANGSLPRGAKALPYLTLPDGGKKGGRRERRVGVKERQRV